MKFRKKPVVIEAVEVNDLIACSIQRATLLPAWAHDAYHAGVLRVNDASVSIRTLEGEMRGERGDWIIRGVKGELYPCKPDIFAATYERVED